MAVLRFLASLFLLIAVVALVSDFTRAAMSERSAAGSSRSTSTRKRSSAVRLYPHFGFG